MGQDGPLELKLLAEGGVPRALRTAEGGSHERYVQQKGGPMSVTYGPNQPVPNCFEARTSPKCVKLSESIVLHVVHFIPGPFYKSLDGAPPAAENSPKKAQISLSQILLKSVPAQNV